MLAEYEEKYHKLEQNHWWFKARRDMIRILLEGTGTSKSGKLLDVGCSDGSLLRELVQSGYLNLFGIDTSQKAVALCKTAGIKNVFLADACATDFPDNSFDVVIASDVLEHIKDDTRAISEFHRILKPNGKLIVFVPAFRFLWSQHDVANAHFKRYSAKQLKTLLDEKFNMQRCSYWNFCLFFPTFAYVMLGKFLGKTAAVGGSGDRLREFNPILNFLLEYLVKAENRILKRVSAPVGVSVFCVAGKK